MKFGIFMIMLQKNRPVDFYLRDKLVQKKFKQDYPDIMRKDDKKEMKKILKNQWKKLMEEEKMPYERAHLEYISKINTELMEENLKGDKLELDIGEISSKVGKIIELQEEDDNSDIEDTSLDNVDNNKLVQEILQKVKPKKVKKDLKKKFNELVLEVNDIYEEVIQLKKIIEYCKNKGKC